MKKKLILLVAAWLSIQTVVESAVFTETQIKGVSGIHKLLISIPDDYNASKKYPLVIGLHYCGGTAIKYRLGLKPLTDSLKMIVACPDNSGNVFDSNKTDLITAAIDSVKSMYSIDETSVYLNGMSCNAEVTLQQGMKKLYPFKGIFPWAPYISKVDNKAINLNSDMPVTISIGTADEYYYGVVLDLYDSLKTHGANVNLVLVPGIKHTQDFPQFGNEMIHSIYYINDNKKIVFSSSIGNSDSYKMFDTDAEKVVEFKVSHIENKELTISSVSSNVQIVNTPEIEYTPLDSVVKVKIQPIPGKVGKVVIVIEAKEKNGVEIEQTTFKVQVAKIPTSLSAVNSDSKIEVYPNPASKRIYLKCDDHQVLVQITDMNGRVVIKTKGYNSSGIDVSSLNKGMYFLTSIGKIESKTVKFSVR